jgi:interferon gamma-inducible protein 30
MTFQDFPYGNANEVKNADGTYTYSCQHGVNECIGNMYEACAMEHYPAYDPVTNIPQWWNFFYCMEKSGTPYQTSTASNCAASGGLDWNVITTCSTTTNPAQGSTTDGNPYMHQIALATNNLVPPHQWTPWVTINGVALNQAQLDMSLLSILCTNYWPSGKPSCCP